jgi:hypothetical protein
MILGSSNQSKPGAVHCASAGGAEGHGAAAGCAGRPRLQIKSGGRLTEVESGAPDQFRFV